MSEASRAHALQHAATVHAGSGDAATTLATAEAFHDFISGSPEAEAPAKTPAKAAVKAPVKAPAKAAVKTPVVEDDAAAEEGEVTKEQVAEAIEALLNNNLRAKAIALFAKYKAKSMSGVAESDYAALKQDADDALLSA